MRQIWFSVPYILLILFSTRTTPASPPSSSSPSVPSNLTRPTVQKSMILLRPSIFPRFQHQQQKIIYIYIASQYLFLSTFLSSRRTNCKNTQMRSDSAAENGGLDCFQTCHFPSMLNNNMILLTWTFLSRSLSLPHKLTTCWPVLLLYSNLNGPDPGFLSLSLLAKWHTREATKGVAFLLRWHFK